MVKATIQMLKGDVEKIRVKFENKTIIMHKNPFSKEALIIKANMKIVKENSTGTKTCVGK